MEIKEKFYTISESELKRFCKSYVFHYFMSGDRESEFNIDFSKSTERLVIQGRMSELFFCAQVEGVNVK
jgi:hypothetical protein